MAPPAGQIRPGRYLAAFALIVAVLYALVFFTGDGKATPKLGIDLQGGTRVTLTARSPDGTPPTREALNQAKAIIDQRVNGLGVSGAEVVLDGNNLVITVPGEESDQAKNLGRTAEVNFRKVVTALPAQPQPAPSTQSSAPAAPPGQGGQPGQAGNTTAATPTGTSGAPSAGAKPQGRPVPAAEQQPPTTTPSPTPSTTPAPAQDPNAAVDPKAAEEIRKAKELRQSTDPAVQQQALLQLDCSQTDPLRGNDDPNLPLVTCSEDRTEKFVLDKVFLPGKEVATANAVPTPNGPGFIVELDFKSGGAKTWGDFTSANVGQRAAFVLDTQVVSAPRINEAILGGKTQISGQFNQQSATELANVLKYGALPLSFGSSEAETVSATLGLASLKAGLLAGAIGLALVFVYCLFYYRALGVLTILSLALSGVLVYAVLVLIGRWIGYTLDLAGVAGFIVSIGITADSFIVFFERLKDEVREGRSFRSAVPRAWTRARRTILSADAVSFLAAAVLYVLAVGQVKGFAFTMGMSTVLDLVVVFLATHPLVVYASRSKFLSRPSLSGLGGMQRIGASNRAAAAAAAGKVTSTSVKEA
ncbi:preprotein translocase subunit SecD [Streptoalloteichus tenebrarius]|uniref:Protein translocase subunit SecD n=1 Tax=Streptoalloteichus tenebrarius (strain ATCC 17920 / DSM 40477 / JCM 4838 / CBS 697.72 / NBRC 16177 / NCIMB 11028 / NRRL B-12390 / A12253. 1 / ISP 5477) TaxID=1933 RepID=A0ABT1HSA1_STRSD|nr:protein translocase subunit SecD [Streptoalloteichus tenebrarius]MCP2258387.1 preprotein translocase subunit SecD [Streptoalloteichus tenebrarius]BFF03554.1 protein translocase subunit SecD [Streptoalloteichus tenebrarius]